MVQTHPSTLLKGFPEMMRITGGFRAREFTICCGATGSGKTTLCANISKDLLEQNIPHFVASIETGHLDFIRRIMSAMAKKDLNSGDPVSSEEMKSFFARFAHFFKTDTFNLSLYEDRFSVDLLMADIAWCVIHKGIKIAIVDNLNFFLDVTSIQNQVIEMDRVIHDLVIFCKQVDVHLIMIMHPKKTINGRVESENDIKGSSTANQEAHNIFLWNRPHPDRIKNEIATVYDREFFIAKMRRRGKFVGRTLLMRSLDGVSYTEGGVF